MAVTTVTTTMAGAINYTVVTDSSADWTSVSNSTYFYDKTDKLVHYKDSTGTVLGIFSYSGFQYWAESQNTSAPNATVTVDSLTPISSSTNADVALVPKGTGALLAAIPDNLSTGGNKRGQHAVDLQTHRSSNTKVASGCSSVISGGCDNTASGFYSIVGGGRGNTAACTDSTIGGGYQNTANCVNSVISGGNGNVTNGTSSVISGGGGNTTSGIYSTISGGYINTASNYYSTIGGGRCNTASGQYSAVLGGLNNVASCDYSGIFGCNITSVASNTFHVNNLALVNTPVQDQSATNYLVRDEVSGIVKYKTIPGPTVFGLFSQTSNSTTITATTVESSLLGTGIGSLTVAANGFSVGDSFRADLGGLLSSKNNDTIRIRVKTGSTVLADSGAQTLPSITNDVWQLSLNFTIRATGAANTASIVTLGVFHDVKTANGTQGGFAFNTVNSTTFDTTVSNTLNITVEWSSNSALNSIYSDVFVLNKIY